MRLSRFFTSRPTKQELVEKKILYKDFQPPSETTVVPLRYEGIKNITQYMLSKQGRICFYARIRKLALASCTCQRATFAYTLFSLKQSIEKESFAFLATLSLSERSGSDSPRHHPLTF